MREVFPVPEAPRRGCARRLATAALAAGLALLAGACSVSVPLAGLAAPEPQTTGSVESRSRSPLAPELGPEDWRRARAAMAVALDPQGNGSAVNWDNPETRLKGTFTAAAAPFVKDDQVCRAFGAGIDFGDGGVRRLTGEACRVTGGEWRIDSVADAKGT